MKKYTIVVALFILAGCARPVEQKPPFVAKIGNYEITQDEFVQEFKESHYARHDTPASRKEFLMSLIDRKLIMQDAEANNLDKKKDFLRMIEKFWEQSLVKFALDTKTKQIAATAMVSDEMARKSYDQLVAAGKTEKKYDQVSRQIKWDLAKVKETQEMTQWLEYLRGKTPIEVNEKMLEVK